MPTLLAHGVAAASGALVWLAWLQVLPSAPLWLRAAVACTVLVVGPGAAVARPLRRGADRLEAVIVPLGAGLLTAATGAYVLGWLDALPLFPWLAAASTGVGVRALVADLLAAARSDRRDVVACALVAALAAGAGTMAYAKRLAVDGQGVTVSGSYDSYDSSYYAAMSAELATHVPPRAPFEAGHWLNYSYYPQLTLAMVFRFGEVPLLDLYFRYAWPVLLTMAALTAFMFVRRIATTAIALFSVCLLLLGSDFSYMAAFVFGQRPNWDNLLWSTNWMTPSAEMLYFNPWTPALCVLFLGLWALVRRVPGDERAAVVASGVCFGSLVQFKPFAFGSVMFALAAALATGGVRPGDRRRYALVIGGSLMVALPYLASVAAHYQDSQSVLAFGNGYVDVLPNVVMRQLGFGTVLAPIASALGAEWNEWPATLLPLVAANLLFFVGGVGIRLIGVRGVWRAIRSGDQGQSVWPVMAWMIVAGVVSPLFLVSQPYHQTFQFLHVSLFLLWIFVARAVLPSSSGQRWPRVVIATLVMVCAMPSTVHYLRMKWQDDRSPFAIIDRDAFAVIEYLRREDPERTVLMQHYPDRPCFICTLAERRTLLAWARYARGSASLTAEIDAFFLSRDGRLDEAWSTLTRYHVTHVLESVGSDRIHPALLQSLRPVVVTPTFRLYTVPLHASPFATSGSP